MSWFAKPVHPRPPHPSYCRTMLRRWTWYLNVHDHVIITTQVSKAFCDISSFFFVCSMDRESGVRRVAPGLSSSSDGVSSSESSSVGGHWGPRERPWLSVPVVLRSTPSALHQLRGRVKCRHGYHAHHGQHRRRQVSTKTHHNDVIMSASQITSLTIVYSTVYSRRRSKKTPKLRVTGLCAGISPVTGEFPAQRVSNAENVSIWWRRHVFFKKPLVVFRRFQNLNKVDLMMVFLLSPSVIT